MIILNGSYLEGGGALVRVALALSTLTGKEFKVTNIRAGREEGGLKAQHLAAINALKELCNAQTNDVKLGSTELHYTPGKIQGGAYVFDIGTAGSISLFLQAIILPCLFASKKVTITVKGGTCGKGQASVDYLQNILLSHLQRFAEKIQLKILKRGYYPKGGGEIMLEITPKWKGFNPLTEVWSSCPKILLTSQQELQHIKGVINGSEELADKQVVERIKLAAEGQLKKYNVPINIRMEYAKSLSIGGEILLWGVLDGDAHQIFLGSSALIEKGKSSEHIGKEAAEGLIKELDSGAAVDHYLADQLIPYMALLPGSTIKASDISNHAKTNIYVIEQFLPVKFEINSNSISVLKR